MLAFEPQEQQQPALDGLNNDLDPVYAQFRDQTRFWIQRVAVPLLMVIGLFGNLITMIIMTRRGMRSTTNMYLAALAFVDMLYLVLTFLLGLSHYPNMAGPRYYAYWKLRPFLMMLTDASSNTSVWLTVTFTIERYIAVKYPMKGKVWCTEKRAKMLIVCVFLFGILFASPVPFEWKVIEKRIPMVSSSNTTAASTVFAPTAISADAAASMRSNTTITNQWPAAVAVSSNGISSTSGSTNASPSPNNIDGTLPNGLEAATVSLNRTLLASNEESEEEFGSRLSGSGNENLLANNGGPNTKMNTNRFEPSPASELFGIAENLNSSSPSPAPSPPVEEPKFVNETCILTLDYSDFGRNETYKTIYYWSIAVIFYFVPLFSLMLFNGFLIKSVHQSKRERTKMTRRTIGHQGTTMKPQPLSQQPSQPSTVTTTTTTTTTAATTGGSTHSSSILPPPLAPSSKSKPKPNTRQYIAAVSKGANINIFMKSSSNQLMDGQEESVQKCISSDRRPSNRLKSLLFPLKHKRRHRTSGTQDSSSAKPMMQESFEKCPSMARNIAGQSTTNNSSSHNNKDTTSDGTTRLSIAPPDIPLILNTMNQGCTNTNQSKNVPSLDATIDFNESGDTNVQSSSCDSESVIRQVEANETNPRRNKSCSSTSGNSSSYPNEELLSIQESRCDKESENNDSGQGRALVNTIRTIEGHPVGRTKTSSSRRSTGASGTAWSSSQQTILPASTQERRITIMLIAVVILFLICQIPSAAMLLYTSVREMVPNTNEHALVLAFGNIFNFLVAVNAAGNFILYSFLSKKYRRTFMILFCNCTGSKYKYMQPNRMLSVRFEPAAGAMKNSTSIYQNSSKAGDKIRRDTLV